MTSARVQTFSDAVLAIIITIAVLGIRVPESSSLSALALVFPTLLVYLSSFVVLGIYWVNHHYLFRLAKEVDNLVIWANLNLLFWISLIPFASEWLGQNINQPWPTAIYCLLLLVCGVSYSYILIPAAIRNKEVTPEILPIIQNSRRKRVTSLLLYVIAALCAFSYPLVSYLFVVAVAVIWFVPDRHFFISSKR